MRIREKSEAAFRGERRFLFGVKRRVRELLRWRCQYRLRTLLVVTALVALLLGIVCSRAHRQREGVELVRRLGGECHFRTNVVVLDDLVFSPDFIGQPVCLETTIVNPGWRHRMARVLGPEYADDLCAISLSGKTVSSSDMAILASLPRLEYLDLSSSQIDSDGMRYLSAMTQLEWLVLNDTRVRDSDLEGIGRLPKLRCLCLSRTKISDEGMRFLTRATKLARLDLSFTGISDEGIRHIEGLEQLGAVYVGHTKVSDISKRRNRFLKPRPISEWHL